MIKQFSIHAPCVSYALIEVVSITILSLQKVKPSLANFGITYMFKWRCSCHDRGGITYVLKILPQDAALLRGLSQCGHGLITKLNWITPLASFPVSWSHATVISLCWVLNCKLFGAGTRPMLCSLYSAIHNDGAISLINNNNPVYKYRIYYIVSCTGSQ